MPHRVKKAVKKLDSLKMEVKEGEVLKQSVVDVAMKVKKGKEQLINRLALIQALLLQFKAFQMSFDDEVIEATKAGTLLANELLEVI